MAERDDLLATIAATTADYRKSDLPARTPEHVGCWIDQFDAEVRLPMLREMNHVLKRTYFSRKKTREFLEKLLQSKEMAGEDPCGFWKGVKFLDIQGGGASQTQMLALLGKLLKTKCGLKVSDCGRNAEIFVYIDDATFSGNRVKNDIEKWITSDAPAKAVVHIVMIAIHTGAKQYTQHYPKRNIVKAAKDAGKDISFEWWSELTLESQKIHADSSDVLWPVRIPNDATVTEYVEAMTHKPYLRTAGQVGGKEIYSSGEARHLLEEEFLKAGVRIRQMCPNLHIYHRPLGNMVLETLGFGSLVVTFRNCPNNAPLALWVGDPWYPLFPRTSNSSTAMLAQDDF